MRCFIAATVVVLASAGTYSLGVLGGTDTLVVSVERTIEIDDSSSSSSSESSSESIELTTQTVPSMRIVPYVVPPVKPRKSCPNSSWKRFSRSGGREVCLKYFAMNDKHLNPDTLCAGHSAKVAGFESEKERNYVLNTAVADFKKRGIKQGSVWLGAKRAAGCYKKNCRNAKDNFNWSDGFTKGNVMLLVKYWLRANPDNAKDIDPKGENCLEMMIRTSPKDAKFRGNEDILGKINDIPCSAKTSLAIFKNKLLPPAPFRQYGTVCGLEL